MKRRLAAKTGRTAAMQRDACEGRWRFPKAAARLVAAVVLAGTLAAGGAQAQDKPPDDSITAQVRTALHADARLARMEIKVETTAGVVSLTGFVRTLEDISQAEGVARGVSGVSAVRNHLRIANRPSQA
jgi:osmotically-inducible protein OsmY